MSRHIGNFTLRLRDCAITSRMARPWNTTSPGSERQAFMQITREEETREKEQEVQQYLTFMIAGEEYGISLLKVKEIIEYDTVTPVPKTPEWIRGVINLRGSVVPVIDLAVKFRLPSSVASRLTCIVIAEVQCGSEATVLGVMADSVRQVIDLKPNDVEQPPAFGTRVNVEYLLGMAR